MPSKQFGNLTETDRREITLVQQKLMRRMNERSREGVISIRLQTYVKSASKYGAKRQAIIIEKISTFQLLCCYHLNDENKF